MVQRVLSPNTEVEIEITGQTEDVAHETNHAGK
jgi:hypothetical protein